MYIYQDIFSLSDTHKKKKKMACNIEKWLFRMPEDILPATMKNSKINTNYLVMCIQYLRRKIGLSLAISR